MCGRYTVGNMSMKNFEDAATDFRSHTVSSLVNSRKNEGPELVRPVKRSLQGEFDFT